MARWLRRSGILFAAVGGLALSAHAVLPSPERVARAVAEVNRAGGRVAPLRIAVELRLERGPVRSGVLVSVPTRGARLELLDETGSVERHTLRGAEYTMSRDGRFQESFHRLLPPLFLLQAGSGELLREQLEELGADSEALRLGRLEDRDCHVLGGRETTQKLMGGRPTVSLWSDLETHEPLQVVTREGVEYRLGPSTLFDSTRLPAWIEIVEPGGFRARLALQSASPVPTEPSSAEAAVVPESSKLPSLPRGEDGNRAIGE